MESDFRLLAARLGFADWEPFFNGQGHRITGASWINYFGQTWVGLRAPTLPEHVWIPLASAMQGAQPLFCEVRPFILTPNVDPYFGFARVAEPASWPYPR